MSDSPDITDTPSEPSEVTVPQVTLSAEQEAAVDRIKAWEAQGKDGDIFKLGGYAGTGKTTVIKRLIADWPGAAVVAFTGKAVSVLRKKGVTKAETLHSLMYDPVLKDGMTTFVKKDRISASLVIVDEDSMISKQLYEDLMSFNPMVLYVGDPGQLEPVGDDPYLMREPDIILETIFRQGEGSPILLYAGAVRQGKTCAPGSLKNELFIRERNDFWDEDLLMNADSIIVGFNKTRHDVNNRLRKMYGRTGIVSQGEKIICLKNNRSLGVFNGMILWVSEIHDETHDSYITTLRGELGEVYAHIPLYKLQFGKDKERGDEFKYPMMTVIADYGYAITAHKSQGSEWDRVLVKEEISQHWNPNRWRYTAVTRAAKRLDYCLAPRF